jgi:MFS superfamily sulfate permease-like transporter
MSSPSARSSPGPAAVVVVRVGGPVSPGHAQRLYAQLAAQLDEQDPVCVLCRVTGLIDLSVLDVLARVALIARRRHISVRVASTQGDLEGLLTLTGLASVVTLESGCASQSAGEAEPGEEGGIEKVVDVGDRPV